MFSPEDYGVRGVSKIRARNEGRSANFDPFPQAIERPAKPLA
jgi:hypothetical protein